MPKFYDSDSVVRVDEEATIGVKTIKSSSGGNTTYTVNKLRHVNPELSDTNAYILGEGWASMTDHSPEDITLTITCSLQVED